MSANKMFPRIAGFCVLAAMASVATAEAKNVDRITDRNRDRIHLDSAIYGSELMTRRKSMQYHERLSDAKGAGESNSIMRQHREELRDANAAKERERILKQYHEMMRERAGQQGVNLPD